MGKTAAAPSSARRGAALGGAVGGRGSLLPCHVCSVLPRAAVSPFRHTQAVGKQNMFSSSCFLSAPKIMKYDNDFIVSWFNRSRAAGEEMRGGTLKQSEKTAFVSPEIYARLSQLPAPERSGWAEPAPDGDTARGSPALSSAALSVLPPCTHPADACGHRASADAVTQPWLSVFPTNSSPDQKL